MRICESGGAQAGVPRQERWWRGKEDSLGTVLAQPGPQSASHEGDRMSASQNREILAAAKESVCTEGQAQTGLLE